MKVKKDSWHYEIASISRDPSYMDSCEYYRAVIFNLLWLLMSGAVILCGVLGVALFLGTTIGELVASTIYGFDQLLLDSRTWVTIVALAVASAVLTIWLAIVYISNKMVNRARNASRTPGFFAQSYDRVKNKYCSQIEVIDEKD